VIRARFPLIGSGMVIAAVAMLADTAASRCSYVARFPPAIGRHSFLMAVASSRTVSAVAEVSAPRPSRSTVPAQIMTVRRVAGLRADEIRDGLRTSGDSAVFIRYLIDPGCGPFAPADGAFDSFGTGGLYIGVPRTRSEWIGGRPTFDVFKAEHLPLPERLDRPKYGAHLVLGGPDTGRLMSSDELFDLYASVWSESVVPGDTSTWTRVRDWLARNPTTARKRPASEVANRAMSMVAEAPTWGRPVALGGTYRVAIAIPGIDSLVIDGRTATAPRVATTDVQRDSTTGIITRSIGTSFVINLVLAPSAAAFDQYTGRGGCASVPITVTRMPIVLDSDSSWTGEIALPNVRDCLSETSALRRAWLRAQARGGMQGSLPVIFRKRADGSVFFDAHASRNQDVGISIHGERTSEVTAGPHLEPPAASIL
jgi:hypothetical protein